MPPLRALGFARAKPTFFVRERLHWCEFVHAHKFSGAGRFRLHAGIRILNCPREFVVLNGPETLAGDRRFSLSFANSEESWERCSREFPKFVELVAQPWFDEHASLDAMRSHATSFGDVDLAGLEASLRGEAKEGWTELSRKVLGLKHPADR